MCCSGSESSDVEHYRPKTIFPELAMTWGNFLWSCTICNRAKGNRFPAGVVVLPINPLDENVWDFFFLDQFGNLVPKWQTALNDLDPRAVATQNLLKLDRQALQESRRQRRQELERTVQDTLARHHSGQLTLDDLTQRRAAWLAAPFQPDVADYYLKGPGRSELPFSTFLALIQ